MRHRVRMQRKLVTSPIKISRAGRDAIYEEVMADLTGIDGVMLAISDRDFEKADVLGRRFSDDLQLILDGLRWADGPTGRGEIILRVPDDVLRRVMARIKGRAEQQDERDEAERAIERDRARLVSTTCDEVLAAIGAGPE